MKSKIVVPGFLLGLLALAGCATSPISKNLREQAKPLTLQQVAASPEAYKGSLVIWGGKVIQTVNDTNGGRIYVLQLPLDCQQAPESSGVSSGRFIARSSGFIDPEEFKQGKLITVAGVLVGTQTEPLQKTQYTYPVLSIRQLHLWHPVSASPYYYGYGPGWYGPYGPGWGPGWGWGWGPGWYGPGWGWYGSGWGGW